MTSYRDFEDLRDNSPAAYGAEIAVDLKHADPERLAALWAASSDGEFRLALTGAAGDFWEKELRGGEVEIPDDHFAMELVIDSYADPEMGHTIYLEGNAYCGSEAVGDLCWNMLADDELERRFAAYLAEQVVVLLGRHAEAGGLVCEVEVTEVYEL